MEQSNVMQANEIEFLIGNPYVPRRNADAILLYSAARNAIGPRNSNQERVAMQLVGTLGHLGIYCVVAKVVRVAVTFVLVHVRQ